MQWLWLEQLTLYNTAYTLYGYRRKGKAYNWNMFCDSCPLNVFSLCAWPFRCPGNCLNRMKSICGIHKARTSEQQKQLKLTCHSTLARCNGKNYCIVGVFSLLLLLLLLLLFYVTSFSFSPLCNALFVRVFRS